MKHTAALSMVFFIYILVFHGSIIDGKPNYRLVLEAVKNYKEYKGNDILQVNQARGTKYNRTTTVFNGSYTAPNDLPPELLGFSTCYEKQLSGKYSLIPLNLLPPTNLCSLIKNDKMFYPDLLKHSNLPTECPWLKGEYHIHNYIFGSETYPAHLPGERWKCDVGVMYKGVVKVKSTLFFFIDRTL